MAASFFCRFCFCFCFCLCLCRQRQRHLAQPLLYMVLLMPISSPQSEYSIPITVMSPSDLLFRSICFLLTLLGSGLMLSCNVISYFLRYCFYSKAKDLTPSKSVIVITGCDSGFGKECAFRFSDMGFKVVAACLTTDGIKQFTGSSSILAVVCNITKEEDVNSLVVATTNLMDRDNLKLWGLVNNAGIAVSRPLDWMTLDMYRKVMDVNFFGHVSVTQAFLPLLKRCRSSRIVNLSSLAGINGTPNLSAYCASKHAMEAFMKCLRDELRPWNIHVCNINPGFMRTPITASSLEKSMEDLKSVPVEVRAQYQDPMEVFQAGEALIRKSLEDPKLVVDKIVCAMTDAIPDVWYFPGMSASFFRAVPLASSDTHHFLAALSGALAHKPTEKALLQAQGPSA